MIPIVLQLMDRLIKCYSLSSSFLWEKKGSVAALPFIIARPLRDQRIAHDFDCVVDNTDYPKQ
jgi:hypothetical protein